MQSRNIVPCVSSKRIGVIPFAKQTQYPQETPLITGITRDSAGTALPGCIVDLFTTADDVRRGSTLSDLVTGAYSFQIGPDTGPYYCVACKPGLPEVGGVTVDSLISHSNAFNSTLMTGCQLWAKADVLGATLNNGALIASWADSSGSGNTLTQASDASKPVFNTNVINGFPAVLFPAIDTAAGMVSTAPAEQKPVTFFAVCCPTYNSGDITRFILDSVGIAGLNFLIDWGSSTTNFSLALYKGTPTLIASGRQELAGSQWHVLEATYSATGEYALWGNGISNIQPGTNDQSLTATSRRVGDPLSITTVAPYIAEVLQFDSVLSIADRSIVRMYLGRKYAITVRQ